MDQVLDPSGGNGGFLMGPGGAGSAGVSPSAATDNSKLRPANLKQSVGMKSFRIGSMSMQYIEVYV